MRLGGHHLAAQTGDELDAVAARLDQQGLSTIVAPRATADWDEGACAAFGARARDLGIVIGEAHLWDNLLCRDQPTRAARIARCRRLLRNAEAMGCSAVVVLVGSTGAVDHPLAMAPGLDGDEGRAAFREVALRILDGLELRRTALAVEPWHNTFFYQPEDIAAFLAEVGHPALAVHFDPMNMVDRRAFFRSRWLIDRAFALLAPRIRAVHLKDIAHDHRHMFLKWDEVLVGEGVMDHRHLLARVARELPPDTPCFCEHLDEAGYRENFRRLHRIAGEAGVAFITRGGEPHAP